MDKKGILGLIPGILLLCLIVLVAVRKHGGMPLSLPVALCVDTMEFYPPKYADLCGDTLFLEPGAKPIIVPVSKAFKLGFKPAEKPLREGYFSEYDVTLLTEMLDHLGIWKVHLWNADGTWRD